MQAFLCNFALTFPNDYNVLVQLPLNKNFMTSFVVLDSQNFTDLMKFTNLAVLQEIDLPQEFVHTLLF